MIMYYIALYIGRLLQKRNNLTKLVAQTAIQERRSCAGSKTSRCRYQKQEGMSVVQGEMQVSAPRAQVGVLRAARRVR